MLELRCSRLQSQRQKSALTHCHDFLLREWVSKCLRAEDWITSPQIPSRFRAMQDSIVPLHGEARRIAANIAKLPEH